MDSAHCAGPRFDERYQASVAVSSLQRPWSKPSGPQRIREKARALWHHKTSELRTAQEANQLGSRIQGLKVGGTFLPTSKRLHKPRP